MVDIAGNLENQAVTLAPDAQSLATQAFQTAVAPLREGSQERLTGTLESLSQRGIQFGELGTENVQDLLERESKKEAQLASEIGTSFGKTQLEQAFAASEAAKNRTLQTELTEKGFEFQTGERLGSEEFAAEQTVGAREFASGEAALGREFSSDEATRARDFVGTEAELNRDFTAEQNSLGRTFNAEESELQRTYQEAFATNRETFQADQTQVALQEDRNRVALQLALEGQITGDNVDQVLRDTFGEGTVLTTNDERDFQRLATASGLTVEEYTSMRTAIGQGQLADIIENPGDYVDSPSKAQRFQLALATMQLNAQREANGLTPITQEQLQSEFPDTVTEDTPVEGVSTQSQADQAQTDSDLGVFDNQSSATFGVGQAGATGIRSRLASGEITLEQAQSELEALRQRNA